MPMNTEEYMAIVSTNQGDFTFQSVDDVIEFVQTAAQEKGGLWARGRKAL